MLAGQSADSTDRALLCITYNLIIEVPCSTRAKADAEGLLASVAMRCDAMRFRFAAGLDQRQDL